MTLDEATADDPVERDDQRRDRRLLGLLVVAVLVVLGGLYAAGWAFSSDRLPRGTTVAGVDVGGLRPERAEAVLARELRPRLDDPVALVVGDDEAELDPGAAGLELDAEASVAQVPVGRSWNPADMWETFVGGDDYPPVVAVDDARLGRELEAVAAEVDEPPVEGAVTFTAEGPQPTFPEAGQTLDVAAAADAVAAAYPSAGEPVALEVATVAAEVSTEDVERAMRRFANPAMSGPVTVALGTESVELTPAELAPALSMTAEDGRLVPRVDGERLATTILQGAGATVAREPRDATVRIVGGRPQVVPARPGVSVDAEALASALPDALVAEGDERRLELPTEVAEPERTTEEVEALGIVEEVSEFTTYYPHADYRNVNIGRAAELVDGTLLEPGDVFSLNRTVGERTAENGFTKGFIISDGVFKEDYGGGVSQVATTTFNAAFFAGLEDVEHKPHSFYIDRYPVGREATVAWPTVDLRFRNDTDHGVLVETVHNPSTPSTQGSITVRMWSTEVWDVTSFTSDRYSYVSPSTRVLSGPECIPNEGYSGFSVDVTRVFREPGSSEVVRRERFHTDYIPSDTVVCR